ncbi:ABC transporter substrate-binding protein [Listeria booriae]|uniref:ABC transporter substrate-binding protein n=1 Tax=Listeria booriae TaxID=1552123 RepID=A0A7X0Z5F9_9LIST|nr:ABC transporter substrate-binding protein [Listeria booriae]MBC2176324.1 ABC transporter substrate-binding protein [Listeria booriae]
MKRLLLFLVMVLILVLEACGNSDTASVAGMNESQLKQEAKGKTVHFYMWGGDKNINAYIDNFVTPNVKNKYDITLKRIPMDTEKFIQKLNSEKQAGKKDGSIDLVWINGQNFKIAKDNHLLYGKITEQIPNVAKLVDPRLTKKDAGNAIEEMEAPWGKTSFVLQYNSKEVAKPPLDLQDLTAWVKANPGRFTYPDVADFTGDAFVRQIIYAQNPGKTFTEAPTKSDRVKAYTYLQSLAPYLWREGKTYPKTLQELDQLYAQGQVDFTMGFNERRALPFMEDGTFPKTTRTFAFDNGALTNAHYLSMAFNTQQPAASLVVINYLLSEAAQAEKLKTSVWGDGTTLLTEQMSPDWQARFKVAGKTGNQFYNSWQALDEFPDTTAEAIQKEWSQYVYP